MKAFRWIPYFQNQSQRDLDYPKSTSLRSSHSVVLPLFRFIPVFQLQSQYHILIYPYWAAQNCRAWYWIPIYKHKDKNLNRSSWMKHFELIDLKQNLNNLTIKCMTCFPTRTVLSFCSTREKNILLLFNCIFFEILFADFHQDTVDAKSLLALSFLHFKILL